jgi:hypothetical protein
MIAVREGNQIEMVLAVGLVVVLDHVIFLAGKLGSP